MLAPLDPPTNGSTTPGSSSEALTSSRAPQEANYQLDDASRASAMVAASPQHITEAYTVSSTYTADSPYGTPSTTRSPHVQASEYSPSVNHPQAYSPALSSNYIPPPSPTPSQLNAYPAPEGQHQQNLYQDPYQQTYQQTYQNQQAYQQQPYPEPTYHSYPEPALVDTVDEKFDQASSLTKPASNNGRRKKIIWIGSIVILILIGAIVGIVVSKNKDSDNNSDNSSSNSSSGNGSSKSSTAPTPTSSSSARNPVSSVPVTVSLSPVTVSSVPVTVPTPTSSSSGSLVTPTPPPFPEKGQCPSRFCSDWYWDCRNNVCGQDGNFKICANKCNGDVFCISDCKNSNPCHKECDNILTRCYANCR
ncbi:MAG: hypothetical protein JOS17DRAFT_772704 [Linnemannia elongata]|nr:MAG: hypothetical protein JOS17DRAFT_772704 [Linnemannia elongata]